MNNFRFKMAGKTFRVINSKEVDAEDAADYTNCLRLIRIDPDYHETGQQEFESFVHECGHAWLRSSGMVYQLKDGDDEETFCENFALYFADLLWPYFKSKFPEKE